MLKWAAIGECMLELRHQTDTDLHLGFAGDSFNVAVYLARSTQNQAIQVHYASALGTDPYSDAMLAYFASENISTENITRLPQYLPGLYFIRTDTQGERTFYYYRSNSAAKHMFNDLTARQQLQNLIHYDWLYFSGISLAILDDNSRELLFNLLHTAKQKGARIAFDTNYRPTQWPSLAIAQTVISRFLSLVDLALPTFSDEVALFGDKDIASTIARLQAHGVTEVAIKCGSDPCVVVDKSQRTDVPAQKVATIVDTTAAGDSFNGAYLAARLANLSPTEAAMRGHDLAARVIAHPGAILPY